MINYVGFVFVGYDGLIQAASSINTKGFLLIAQMQQSLDLWEGILTATGGSLCHNKSCWCLVDYKFVKKC